MATKLSFHRGAKEYLHYPVTGLPADVTNMEIRFTPTGTWLPMDWSVAPAAGAGTARILIAGPEADPTGALTVLPLGSYTPDVRLADSPEIIVRVSPSVIVVR